MDEDNEDANFLERIILLILLILVIIICKDKIFTILEWVIRL